MHTQIRKYSKKYLLTLAFTTVLSVGTARAQQAKPADAGAKEDEEVIVLSPFEVSATENQGYTAATTLAGNRLNTDLRDIGNAVSVVTTQFLKDIGATSNETLLQYTTGTEVGNVYGNFAGTGDGGFLDESNKFTQPNNNTRVRGLTSADNTRDYFLTDIPWDGYSVDGVDLQRGPNSILFGQGSPAGIINIRTKQASFRNSNEITTRFGSFGSKRITLDVNRVLIKDQLAFRIAAVANGEQYKQDPAYESQRRIFGAVRFEPGFLKKGSARTIFKATFEAGSVSSNRPRSLPPVDLITPWFQSGTYKGKYVYDVATKSWGNGTVTYNNLNKSTYIPSQLTDNNTGLPNRGQTTANINGGPNAGNPNPYYSPIIGNFGSQYGGILDFFNSDASANTGARIAEPRFPFGINSAGAIDAGIGGMPFQRPGGIATMAQFAKNAGLPWAQFGVYKDNSLTDPSIFDFYNQLLDGPNKHEWQNFRTYNMSLAQTFFHDKIGFELNYNNEWWKGGQLSLLSGDRQAIFIDINSMYGDGTPNGKNGITFADGTPNPNVGRAFLSDNGLYGNSQRISNKESARATVFATHDFARNSSNVFMRFLGRHTLTGLAAKDTFKSDNRSWGRYGILDAAYQQLTGTSTFALNANELVPNTVIYLGPTLSGASSAAGAHLPAPTAAQVVTNGTVTTFDSHWNKPTSPSAAGYVDPAAPWHNNYYPLFLADGVTPNPTAASGDSTQAENPANYVGWRAVPYTVTDSETAPGNRDLLTHDAQLQKSIITSTAAVWQAHFWDNSMVATWGARKDISKSWALSESSTSGTSTRGIVNLNPDVYKLPTTYNRLEVQSHAWTTVAHLNQLPFVSQWTKSLPIQVSLFYNQSSNFQPASQRVDIYGDPIAPPNGKTVDKGILLETDDGKYSLKINKYETSAVNASSGAIDGTWFIGSSQAWAGNWVNRFEFNWTADDQSGAVNPPDPTNSQYNYAQAPGETVAQAQAREASVIAAWRAWQKSVNPKFYTTWNINLNDHTKALGASGPSGLAVTEDSKSTGYEIEFSAQPTRNWRLTMNASKSTAVRNNIGGAALTDFVQGYQKALAGGAPGTAGDLRIWWGAAGADTALNQWNSTFGSNYALRKLQEGTNVPELRQWHLNAITNYDFDQGILKGVNAGVGIRYESSIVIGYPPQLGATLNDVSFDLSRPYKGPAQKDFDFWVGYSRKLTDKIDWNIQLNLRNAFVGDELIPITTQPDGTPASYRIRPPQTWTLTNTFKF